MFTYDGTYTHEIDGWQVADFDFRVTFDCTPGTRGTFNPVTGWCDPPSDPEVEVQDIVLLGSRRKEGTAYQREETEVDIPAWPGLAEGLSAYVAANHDLLIDQANNDADAAFLDAADAAFEARRDAVSDRAGNALAVTVGARMDLSQEGSPNG